MNKIQTVLFGGVMALSLAACNTTDPDTMSDTTSGSSMSTGATGTTGTTGTWGSSSGSGQTGTNTGVTNDVNPGTATPPPTTSQTIPPMNVPTPGPN